MTRDLLAYSFQGKASQKPLQECQLCHFSKTDATILIYINRVAKKGAVFYQLKNFVKKGGAIFSLLAF